MIRIRFALVLTLIVYAQFLFAVKPDTVWKTAKLLTLNESDASTSGTTTTGHWNDDGTMSQTTSPTNWKCTAYGVVLDDGKIIYYGNEVLCLRWQHTPQFTENEAVKFILKGAKLTVLDDEGKEIKMRLVKKRIKE